MAGGKLSRVLRAVEEATGLDLPDLAVKGAKAARRDVKRTPELPMAKALPAPTKPLALPKPAPKPPSFVVKPKGGQWYADKAIGAVRPSDLGVKVGKLPDDNQWFVKDGEGRLRFFDKEDDARAMGQNWVDSYNKNASVENAVRRIAGNRLGLTSDANGPLSQLQNWFLRAAPRYIKNEMGTAEDPMRSLAERGALHIGLSPDEWSQAAGEVIRGDTIGDVLGLNQLYPKEGSMPGAGDDFRANVLTNMPWLAKAPVTDEVYRIGDTHTLQEKMGLGHILDEMRNALDDRSGLPANLAVRPESLGRMSFAQAAERVGQINQWRAKMAEGAQTSALNNPAIHTFKEYAENNPMGLRWVELKAPGEDAVLDTSPYYLDEFPGGGYDARTPDGVLLSQVGKPEEADPLFRRDAGKRALQQALKYEGDTMGHCVGGYCDDVLSGRSRIFSLRDAKGEPHVTVETSPGARNPDRDTRDAIFEQARLEIEALNLDPDTEHARILRRQAELADAWRAERKANPPPEDIIQIKGKQNRAPKDDYLPFVQDFVKSGQWGNIGDLGNTGLVRLPDGRYITQQQMQEAMSAAGENGPRLDEHIRWLSSGAASPEDGLWQQYKHHFEGFAIGGRVDANRCFSRHPMAVR